MSGQPFLPHSLILRGRRGTYGTGLARVARSTGLVAGDATALCLADVALGDICLVSRGSRGIWRHPPSFCVAGVALMALGWLWWCAWTGLVAGDAVALCVAGVALGDIGLVLTWQVWHLATSTRRVWQTWHLWHWAGSGGALGLD